MVRCDGARGVMVFYVLRMMVLLSDDGVVV